jgi:hypothetical protein
LVLDAAAQVFGGAARKHAADWGGIIFCHAVSSY